MSSRLTSLFMLRRSSWYSLGRLISSFACMPWNSSTSASSGVVISITLAMVCSCDAAALPRAHDKPLHGNAGFQAQVGAYDVRAQAGLQQDPLDVITAVVVAPVRLDAVVTGVVRKLFL